MIDDDLIGLLELMSEKLTELDARLERVEDILNERNI
jgi:hypothetical protein